MQLESTVNHSFSLTAKLKDINELTKLRLSFLVVFSTFICYLLGSDLTNINWTGLWSITIGGFFVVMSSNGINQIIERNTDALMKRTENRPIVQKRMTLLEASIIATIFGFLGVLIIGLNCNFYCAVLSFISLVLYAFVYTPLKRITKLSVHIGAIPGAMSPLIGYVAANGGIDLFAMVLFIIQFAWQFPHFYSIAWLLDEDYQRAGLKLMPIGAKKDKAGAFQISILTFITVPISFIPYLIGFSSIWASIICAFLSLMMFINSIRLVINADDKSARRLMFSSFYQLPGTFITLLIDKMI